MPQLPTLAQWDTSPNHEDSYESKVALLGFSAVEVHNHRTARGRKSSMKGTVALLAALIAFIALCSSIATLYVAPVCNIHSINEAVRKTSIYSPAFDDTDIRLIETKMNGSVFQEHIFDTPWAGETSDAAKEAVWDDFNYIRTVPLTREQLLKIGKDPRTAAKYDDAYWGMGEEIYIGGLDLFHQIRPLPVHFQRRNCRH